MKRTHDSTEARCPLCDKKFKNKHSLGVHQSRYHPRHGQPQQAFSISATDRHTILNATDRHTILNATDRHTILNPNSFMPGTETASGQFFSGVNPTEIPNDDCNLWISSADSRQLEEFLPQNMHVKFGGTPSSSGRFYREQPAIDLT